MPNVPQAPPPDPQSLAARVAALEEAFRRLTEATGVPLLPVPASPGHRHLWPVPPLAAG